MLLGGVKRVLSASFIAAALLLGSVGADVSAADGRRIALVIGNGGYKNLPKLTNPPRDAALIADKLRSVGFEVDLAIDDSQSNLKQRVRNFGLRARGASAALFYYAGHGLQAKGSNYLLPVDARLRSVADLRSGSLALSTVSDELEAADAKINLIILDACRDNPLTRSLRRKDGTRSVNLTRGLASVQRASGTLVAYATAPGDVAYDGDGMENSPFTQAVANGIDEPGLEIAPMFRQVREQVIAATNGKQVPWIEEDISGEFYFQPPPIEVAPTVAALPPEPTAPPPDIAGDRDTVEPVRPSSPQPNDDVETAWSQTKNLGTREGYIKFLKLYPNSDHAKDAVAMLLQFAGLGAPATTPPKPAISAPKAAKVPAVVEPLPPSPPKVDDRVETAWSETTALGTREAYIKFLKLHPNSDYAQQAVCDAPTICQLRDVADACSKPCCGHGRRVAALLRRNQAFRPSSAGL